MGNANRPDDHFQAFFTDKSFQEALAMVNEAVKYQEGEGRLDQGSLPPELQGIFVAESMRLTTRLMQIISWFLVQRAVTQGELTPAEALKPSRRMGSVEFCLADATGPAEALPEKMKDLIFRSRSLFTQVLRIEKMMIDEPEIFKNPVHDMLDRLKREGPAPDQNQKGAG